MRPNFRSIFLSIVFAAASSAQDKELRELAAGLADQVAAKGKSPVAVTSFTNPEYGPSFSTFLTDRINVLLVSSNKQFEVVTRDRIEEAFREINLALGKNYDSVTFAKIGKAVGAKALIRGSFTVMPAAAKVSVTAQILDVESGRIVGGALADLPYTGDIRTMLTPLDQREQPAVSGGPAPATVPQVQQVEVNRFLFRLRQCSATRTTVTCKLLITSPERDRTIRFGEWYGITSVFDQGGNEYRLTNVIVGNKSDPQAVTTLLVRDVPVQAELSFNVSGNVTTISLLKIRAGDSESAAFLDVQFRNIRP